MIDQWLVAVLCTCALVVAGLPVALQLAPRSAFSLIAAWLIGCCLLPAAMLAASALGARFSRRELALLWLAVTAVGCALMLLRGAWGATLANERATGRGKNEADASHKRVSRALPVGSYFRLVLHDSAAAVPAPLIRLRRGVAKRGGRDVRAPSMRRPMTLVGGVVCLVQSVYVLLVAVRVPLSSYDAWSVWEYRGRRFWMDGVVSADFLHSQAAIFAHPAYPPVLSLVITWVYAWTGTDNPVYMKLMYPVFYVVLLGAFYLGLRASHSRQLAAPATAILAFVPRITEYAGTGLADVPLTACAVAGMAAYVIARTSRPPAVPMAGLLLGLAPLMKREGLFFLLAAGLSIALQERSLRRTLAWLWPAPVVALPWYLYVAATGVPDRDFLPFTPQDIVTHLDHAAVVGRFFALNLLAINEWNVLWYVLAGILCLALLQRRAQGLWLLPMVVTPLVLYVLALGVSAWPDYLLHARTSLDRLILVTAPFALWVIVEQLDGASTSRRQPAAPAPPVLVPESGR